MLRNFDLVKNGVTKKQPLFLQKCSAIILILQKSVHAFKIIKIKIDCAVLSVYFEIGTGAKKHIILVPIEAMPIRVSYESRI